MPTSKNNTEFVSPINSLTVHLKVFKKQVQTNPKISTGKNYKDQR
jgi:hypothetical protein